jgi:hypothetical protein
VSTLTRALCVGAVVVVAILLPLSIYTGLNRQATLQLNIVSYAVAAALVLVSAATCRFLIRVASDALAKSKTSAWLYATLTGLVIGAAALCMVEVAVPYLPGDLRQERGIVASTFPTYAGSQICDLYGVIRLDSGPHGTVCLERRQIVRKDIDPRRLSTGDIVLVTIRLTHLGIAIESIERL